MKKYVHRVECVNSGNLSIFNVTGWLRYEFGVFKVRINYFIIINYQGSIIDNTFFFLFKLSQQMLFVQLTSAFFTSIVSSSFKLAETCSKEKYRCKYKMQQVFTVQQKQYATFSSHNHTPAAPWHITSYYLISSKRNDHILIYHM